MNTQYRTIVPTPERLIASRLAHDISKHPNRVNEWTRGGREYRAYIGTSSFTIVDCETAYEAWSEEFSIEEFASLELHERIVMVAEFLEHACNALVSSIVVAA